MTATPPSKTMRRGLVAGLVAALVIGGALVWYPLSAALAYWTLLGGAKRADADVIDQVEDKALVRSDLSERLTQSLDNEMMRVSRAQGSPNIDAIVDHDAVNETAGALMSPDSFRQMALSATAQFSGADAVPAPLGKRLITKLEYAGLNRFRVAFQDAMHPDVRVAWSFQHRDLLAWKLVHVDVPESAIRRLITITYDASAP